LKKGDLKKKEILNVSEQLFCKNGYEKTSVQDILDVLHTSKGSFYHHFESKEAVLEEICRMRAESVHSDVIISLPDAVPLQRLNSLLTGMLPFHHEKLPFLMMLLPVFVLPEGRTVKSCYAEALRNQFAPDLAACIEEGIQIGQFGHVDPGTASNILLSLLNLLWIGIFEAVIEAETTGMQPDLSMLLQTVEQYRLITERFLFLPYGSVELTSPSTLDQLCRQIHTHWAIH
jgi:Transcriptional regulator